MTNEEKIQIARLRSEGYGYVKIAHLLSLKENTVKSYCRRNGIISKESGAVVMEVPVRSGSKPCQCCGKSVMQNPGRKEKKFCSDRCRNRWWNSHLSEVNRKAMYDFTCACCKKQFRAYGNANRKYCCHECYIEDRFGGGMND